MRGDAPMDLLIDAPAMVRRLYGLPTREPAKPSPSTEPPPREPSPVQLQILVWLSEHPTDRLDDIGTRLVLTRPTVSRAVSQLVVLGLVREGRSADDARRRSRHLTPKGRARVRSLRTEAKKLMGELGPPSN